MAWGDPPDGVGEIIGDQQGSPTRIEDDADRATTRVLPLQEAGDEIDGLARWPAARERHPNDLVAGQILPIPAAVLADEGALHKLAAKAALAGETDAQGRHVRA